MEVGRCNLYSVSTNNAALGVKPIDWYFQNPYFNADKAGTPESYKSKLTSGGTGYGGTNYTGTFSGTRSISCGCSSSKSELEFVANEQNEIESTNNIELSVMPNPTSSYFKLTIKTNDDQPVSVKISDLSGRSITQYPNLHASNSKSGVITLEMGANWKNGVYMAEVIKGAERQTVKLIKAN